MFVIYLKISVNEIVNLEVFIIITPRVKESFSNLDPSQVSDELNEREQWNMDNWGVDIKWFVLANAHAYLIEHVQLHAADIDDQRGWKTDRCKQLE